MIRDEDLIAWAMRQASLDLRSPTVDDVGAVLHLDGEAIGRIDSVTGDMCIISFGSGILKSMPMNEVQYTYMVTDDGGEL